jgi:hypothetical protein
MSDVATGAATVIFRRVANTLWAATAFTVEIQGSYQVSASSHLLVEDAAFVSLVTAMVAAIPWVT